VNDGFGILLALAAVIAPLALAWCLIGRYLVPREPAPPRKPDA
jgi:hypothetical protein